MRMCWVEFNNDQIIRIFKSRNAAFHLVSKGKAFTAAEVTYEYAVKCIRFELFIRSNGHCETCGAVVTHNSGHMHEQQWRGKGGEISLENSLFICARCHQHEHKGRAPQFTRRKP
jgi:hypothetical protein